MATFVLRNAHLLDLDQGKWIEPSAHTKTRREHHLDLGKDAAETRVVDVNFDEFHIFML